ncbi:phosphatidylinositol 4-phosphate 3-kinase C2 domain-containing subunit alpha [Trichonephila inaurata madagascariensis]|uniref:Phosphatidylinositol 4-phosphate 3-kinase C2 domain-containing subunit alpha n=1 Tax=Trichonephila inaurata madagascariensis TaxID=2747483 RepID=A0A8X6XRN6_9ARAC|nr:phosphatidylinositol 4-phosphate 3-kinase C2 domain-containing subunit alpha [Trichonephila inaurata madagascariensis]
MAAPPIPPKGGSDSWLRGNVVTDPHSWRSDSQNLFSSNTQPKTCFNDNFSTAFCDSKQKEHAPPLPPRPSPEAFQKISKSTFETNELNRVPPPPGSGQLYKNPSPELQRFSSGLSNHSFSSVSNSMVKTTMFQSSMTGSASSSVSRNYISTNVQRCNSLVPQVTQPLAFTNSLYQSQYGHEFAFTGFEVQHSKSAPNIPNSNSSQFSLLTRNAGNCTIPAQNFGNCAVPVSRYSVPNENNLIYNQTTYAVINHNEKLSNNNSHANLENIYKFMKKRSDSNLIDLYCNDHEVKFQNNQGSKCNEDILKLFDPLVVSVTTSPKSESKMPAVEKKSIDTADHTIESCSVPVKVHSIKEENVPETVPKEICTSQDQLSNQYNGKQESILKIVHKSDTYSKEFEAFFAKLKKLRMEFPFDDHVTNAGLVISPSLDSSQEDSLSIKLIISSINSERPVSFTCDVNTSVEHIISHTVCSIFDNASSLSMDNFVLKVHGLSEYFTSHSTLADYEYVHQCHKFDKPVCLTLTDIKDLKRPFARTKNDDVNDSNFKYTDIAPSIRKEVISYESLSILLDILEKEMEKIKSSALKFDSLDSLKPQGVVQAVKAICTLLSHVETSEITDTVAAFIRVCLLYDKSNEGDFDTLPELGNLGDIRAKKSESDLLNLFQLLELSLSHLQHAVHELLVMYAKTFRVNFEIDSLNTSNPEKMVTDFLDTPLFELGIVHRLEPTIISMYESFFIICEIYHGNSLLTSVTSKKSSESKSFFSQIVFEEWLQFENISMCTLPKESILYFTLWGNNQSQSDSKQSNSNAYNRSCLGWCGIRLFSYEGTLAQGSFLLGFWSPEILKNSGPLLSNPDAKCPLIHVRLPDFGCIVKFPPVIDNKFAASQIRDFESLEPHLQTILREIIEKDTLKPLLSDEKELLWERKYYLHQFPNALPKVLLSAHGWDWACLSDLYSLLKAWTPLSPVESLHLLMPCFPNIEVRKTAISWMKDIVSDELCDYLPQMIQILRYEAWDDSPTAWFLLERSLTSVRVAHHLYWLLKQNINDPIAGGRMKLMLNSLLVIAGEAMRERISTQEALLEDLSSIADTIKTTKESLRLSILFHKLEKTHHSLMESPTCLPLSPSLEVCGVDVKSCSYFTSNTLPLKLTFHTPEMTGTNNEAIFKVGDDLRQDMITIQMIRIMDKLWLKEGLDLKIVTFNCVATEFRKGMVEMVPGAETLRKIQTELGLTGSFKDRPIAEWLQKYNTSELEYQQAVENFTLSCAGYCVATYILGICDRHNDNIMLKTSGHIFHIDFGKFLGDSQMFGNIKRDRTPFVLTSDMAYVINGGDKPSKKFQYFIDLCCQAFNIIRSHRNVFFNLFSLMVSSDIPGMSINAVTYIERALLPNMSEAEATVHFTHMIQESLKSWFTQFNFFIHNLAQLRFTGDHNEGFMLSFTSKTYSKESDGKITGADVIGYEKMYDPEKYYIYVVQIQRENLPDTMCVFRTYREFIEFHQKLSMMFPLAKFHPLPGNPLMGRTNVREVADKRKMELSMFLHSLMAMAEEISHCDLVYSFFHPLLRDQEGMERENEAKSLAMRSRRSSSLTEINGQIKISTVYKKDSLFIMVMHAKNLSSPKGTAPDPYVKTYLLPDSNKTTKRKTKIVSKSCHPTFMEMLVYNLPLEVVRHKALHVSVWDYDRVQENEFLGAVLIPLTYDLSKEITQWYSLGQFNSS